MLTEINEKLVSSKERLLVKRRLTGEYTELTRELDAETEKLKNLEIQLRKERKDVEKLEGLSLAGLFHSVLGSKEEQIEKERQELLAAKLQYDKCRDIIAMTEKRLMYISQQLKGFEDAEREYRNIFLRKEKILLSGNSPVAKKIFEVAEKIAVCRSNIRELEEAIQTGNSVIESVNSVVDSLESAQNWGTWDMLGGGFFSTAVKHSRIDDARQSVHQVQHRLKIFSQELRDVDSGLTVDINIDIGSFATFADYFFDGLIADWVVQSGIKDSLQSVLGLKEQVADILTNLHRGLNESKKLLAELDQERVKLVEEGEPTNL